MTTRASRWTAHARHSHANHNTDMIQIKTNGETLDLPSGFSMEIEDTNPIFNDRGSQSLPATVPATRRNIRLLDAPHRIENNTDPNLPEREAEVIAGAYIRKGVVNLTEASRKEGFTMNIGFDNSTAYMKWQKKKLNKLDNLPVYTPMEGQGTDVERLLQDLFDIYKNPSPHSNPFAVFPLAVHKEKVDGKGTYLEILNLVNTNETGLFNGNVRNRVMNNEVVRVTVPSGYAVSPFVRVWKVIELAFQDLGVTLTYNLFKTDTELSRLVVLNNCADAACTGSIKYSDILPDCTVSEFFNALWVRFGVVYNVDYDRKTVRLELLKDILKSNVPGDLGQYIADYSKVEYQERQYVKLSAGTSIEDAAPATDRLEDFLRGIDGDVAGGAGVEDWTNDGSTDYPDWDGDYMDGYYDDYDPDRDGWDDPDPDNPDYGDRDDYDDPDYTRSAPAKQREDTPPLVARHLAREFVTGKWWKLDNYNNKTIEKSSAFFNWDPQPEGCTAVDMASQDECVPIGDFRHPHHAGGDTFDGYIPLYLFGSRHFHSSIKGSDEKESGDTTPLAFLFAYTVKQKTIGRLNGETEYGQIMKLDDGTSPKLSLYFHYKGGLYDTFWIKYDELLRHNNRSVEVKARMDVKNLRALDMLSPYSMGGARVLLDTMTYTMPSGKSVQVDLKLRVIQTQGNGYYNFSEEFDIPDFAAPGRHLQWFVYSDTFGNNLDTAELRQAALDKYIQDNNYQPHSTDGVYYFLEIRSVVLKSMVRTGQLYEPVNIQEPDHQGDGIELCYAAAVTYNIREFFDVDNIPGSGGLAMDTYIGEVTVLAPYYVKFYAAYVPD